MEDELARHILAAILTGVMTRTGIPEIDAELFTRLATIAADKYRDR